MSDGEQKQIDDIIDQLFAMGDKLHDLGLPVSFQALRDVVECLYCWEAEKNMWREEKGIPLPEALGSPPLVQTNDGTVHQLPLRFNGPAYDPALDQVRLTGQCLRVFRMMKGGSWWCLWEISQRTGDPEASISAQIRHLRKPRFGGHTVNKRRRGEPGHGWWEYQLITNGG